MTIDKDQNPYAAAIVSPVEYAKGFNKLRRLHELIWLSITIATGVAVLLAALFAPVLVMAAVADAVCSNEYDGLLIGVAATIANIWLIREAFKPGKQV